MSINKDIKQDNFTDDYQKGIVNLIFTYNWTTEKVKKVLHEVAGITMQQFNLLRILRGSKHPLSTFQIRERMLDKMSDTSRIVDRMVIKGYVKKMISATDKRLVDVTITSTGLVILIKLDAHQPKLTGILKSLSETEVKTFNFFLDKIRQSI